MTALTGPMDRPRASVVLVTSSGRPVGRWSGPVTSSALLDGPITDIDLDRFFLLCPGDVEVADGAEQAIGEMLIHDPDIDLAYSDGIATGDDGPQACLRPGFSPDRLAQQQYLGPVVLAGGRALVAHRTAGGRLNLPAKRRQLEELADRCQAIAHLPQVLYRSSSADPAELAELAETSEHPIEEGAGGRRVGPAARPPVSVIMPTMGSTRRLDGRRVTLCLQAIEAVAANADDQPLEVVAVLTPGTPEDLPDRIRAVLDRYPVERRPALRLCTDERPFNFSNACNTGALAARGDVLVFLNDDTAVVTPDWLDRLAARAVDPEVGAVGARLLFGDGTIQHAGLWSRGGHPVHRYEGFRADHPGHLGSLRVAQNCLAVTGACLAVETVKFHRAGGFCPAFPSSYNDVDLCLKLDALGHRTVVDPAVVVTHYEASTRDPSIEDWELDLLHKRWRRVLIADPYDNPQHLAPGAEEYPAPDPMTLVERRGVARYRHPARVWRRSGPVADLTELERTDDGADLGQGPAVDKERHVV